MWNMSSICTVSVYVRMWRVYWRNIYTSTSVCSHLCIESQSVHTALNLWSCNTCLLHDAARVSSSLDCCCESCRYQRTFNAVSMHKHQDYRDILLSICCHIRQYHLLFICNTEYLWIVFWHIFYIICSSFDQFMSTTAELLQKMKKSSRCQHPSGGGYPLLVISRTG